MSGPRDRHATRRAPRDIVSARTRVVISGLLGVVAGGAVTAVLSWRYGILAAWDVASTVVLEWVWPTVWRMDARTTQRLSQREDPTRAATDVILLTASVVSLVAVTLALVSAADSSGTTEVLRASLGVTSIALSWAVLHTVFALRYARLYYEEPGGGVDFNQQQPPTYRDFAYLAFTIGMTYQVSDTALQEPEIRATALRHALLSFVFGTGILAMSVNLVASLIGR